MSGQFWQHFLAAELPIAKGRALLAELDPSSRDAVQKLVQHPALSPGEKRRLAAVSDSAFEKLLASGAQIISEDQFPEQLETTGNYTALFVDGDWASVQAPCVAIVGTRNASTYGKACAQKFAEALGRAGVTVVSGGALGVDAAAHKGALAGGGKTVAVLAGGIDRIYPPVHAGLFQQIRENGCLVSQFAAGSKPEAYKFLVRNALIAAISHAVLVIEAPVKSGALATAHAAGDMGRELFVLPGSIDNPAYWGSFNLIRDGATLVYYPDQILDALGVQPAPPVAVAEPASDMGSRILAVLSVEPLATERIVERTGLDTSDVLSELTLLELDGRVIRDAGGYALRP